MGSGMFVKLSGLAHVARIGEGLSVITHKLILSSVEFLH